MKFRAYVDQGHWANQLHRLAAAMGKSLDEAVRQQAGLVCIDCMKLTPPFPSEGKARSKALSSGWSAHRKAGEAAVAKDFRRVFRSASNVRPLSRGSNLAERAATLATQGDIQGLRKLIGSAWLDSITSIIPVANPVAHKRQRQKNGRVSPTFRGILVHTGRVPDFARFRSERLEAYGNIQGLYRRTIKRVGIAKAGWLKAADALGVGKRVPAWVRRHGTRNGIFRHEGEGVRQSVVLGSGVPYMQEKGRDLGIVTIALEGRQRLIEKQIAATLRKRKVVQ